jgi:peptide/nickel transport system permease protein
MSTISVSDQQTMAKLDRTPVQRGAAAATTRQVWARLRRDPLALTGVVITLVVLLVCVFAPLIATHDPDALNLRAKLEPPGAVHWFGTDETGRDLFSRLVYGARLSVTTGVIILVITVIIGAALGALAGYAGGWIDTAIMRFADFFISLPYLILAMAIAFTLGASMQNAVISVIVVFWPSYARLVRGQVARVKHAEFVAAARTSGASSFQIVSRHILPQIRSSLIVQFSLDLGFAVVALASLGFIGLGAQPPTAEWGTIIAQSQNYALDHWWYGILPGLTIALTVVGFNLLGDFLQEMVEPSIRGH